MPIINTPPDDDSRRPLSAKMRDAGLETSLKMRTKVQVQVAALQSIGELLDNRWHELSPEVQAAIRKLLGLL
jgi:hypothetical protein